MPWNDNANPGPWGSPGGDDRRDQPRRPGGGGPRRPGGPDFNAGFEELSNRLRNLMGGPGGRPRGQVLALIGGGLVLAWLASGIYQVAPSEKGVVTTFGAYSGQTDPGLNYHLPAPIQAVQKVPFTTLNKTDVGGAASEGGEAARESLMLTGDEQIIDIDFTVTWRVARPDAYVFAIRDPADAVQAAAESAMREVVGKMPLELIISRGRGQVQRETADILQRTLDAWGAGVTVVEVQIRSANPPPEVVAAFRDVQSAEQDADSAVNEANTYRNRVVNEAKGDAARIVQAAQGYREQAVREAQGEAARFNQIYAEYRRAPGVTRDRLYIETMQRILQQSNKVVIDAKGATAPIILPPDVFRPRTQAPVATSVAPEPTQAQPSRKVGQ